MALSKRCIETLLDLVEIKLSTIQIFDREDAREANVLENCRDELDTVLKSKGELVHSALAEKAKPSRSRAASSATH